MKPTRHGPELSTTVALSVSSLPRRTKPPRFTRSYSDARDKRRAFGNVNEGARTLVVRVASFSLRAYSKSLLPQDVGRRLRKEKRRRIYGVGEDSAAGDSLF